MAKNTLKDNKYSLKSDDYAIYTDAEMNAIMAKLFPDKGNPNATKFYWDAENRKYTTTPPVDYLSKVVNIGDYADDIYNQTYKNLMSSYTPYEPVKGNIDALIKAFEEEAAASSRNAKYTYDTTLANLQKDYDIASKKYEAAYNNQRQDLLTSLKRYQAQFEKDSQSQRRDFLTSQAALESAREQANRSVRNSMAARGLGGSGLQQLAMLQNVLAQSSDVSDLANKNQSVMDDLRDLLKQQEEDYDINLKKVNESEKLAFDDLLNTKSKGEASALTAYSNLINSINSALTTNKANAYADNEARYIADKNAALQQAANYRHQAQLKASEASTNAINGINSETNTFASKLEKLSGANDSKTLATLAKEAGIINDKTDKAYTSKEIKKLKNSELNYLRQSIADVYSSSINSVLSSYMTGYGTPVAFNQVTQNNINNLLRGYGFNPYYTNATINGKYIQP